MISTCIYLVILTRAPILIYTFLIQGSLVKSLSVPLHFYLRFRLQSYETLSHRVNSVPVVQNFTRTRLPDSLPCKLHDENSPYFYQPHTQIKKKLFSIGVILIERKNSQTRRQLLHRSPEDHIHGFSNLT